MRHHDTFRFWCQKVLPLVYDQSLSYYEVLCKMVVYLNHVLEDTNQVIEDVEGLRKGLAEAQKWIANFDTSFIKEEIEKYVATMIFIEISDDGYIVYYIPETWKDVNFNTTGLDISVPDYPEYGRLVLTY